MKVEPIEWLTVAEVAALFAVDKTSVYRRLEDGTIPHYKFGQTVRIPAAWAEKELARFRAGETVEEQSQTDLIEEGRRISRALAAAERAGAL